MEKSQVQWETFWNTLHYIMTFKGFSHLPVVNAGCSFESDMMDWWVDIIFHISYLPSNAEELAQLSVSHQKWCDMTPKLLDDTFIRACVSVLSADHLWNMREEKLLNEIQVRQRETDVKGYFYFTFKVYYYIYCYII